MTQNTVDILTAKIKIQLAHRYISDLGLWKVGGDDARFARMVDGRGAGIGSPEKWLHNLAVICTNPVVMAHQPALRGDVETGLAAIGLVLPEEEEK